MIAVLAGLADVERDLIRTHTAEGHTAPNDAASGRAASRHRPTAATGGSSAPGRGRGADGPGSL
jgi:hypothetical protein